MLESMGRIAGIFAVACVCGVASGMFGIGGGVLLVPLLGLLFGFSQHRAQGTSLVALIPPTGVLALMAYSKQGFLSWKTGLLLIPGVFLGGIAGGGLGEENPAAKHAPGFCWRPGPARCVAGTGGMVALETAHRDD